MNGRATAETQRDIDRLPRLAGAGTVGGAIAGVLVAGIGGRLAMRISGIAAGPELQGALTEAGNPVGVITFEGTVGLAVFGGILTGAIGGLLYVAVLPWLAPLGRWRGFGFGIALLLALGSSTIHPENFDFRVFGPPALNVAMFAALFPLFGMAAAPLVDRIEAAAAGPSERLRPVGRLLAFLTWPGALLAALLVVLVIAVTIGDLLGATEGGSPVFGLVTLYVLGVAAAIRATRDVEASRPPLWSHAVLALPLAGGGYLTIAGILDILL